MDEEFPRTMRRLRILHAMNWKYALGEIALIMVGILLALAASDWFRDRELIREERQVLQEIRAALGEDRDTLEQIVAQAKEAEELIAALQVHIQQGGPYAPELDRSFGAAYGLRLISLNRAAFESLKSRGLGLVRDSELRSRITRNYSTIYDGLDLAQQGQRNVILEGLRPYFLTHFKDLDFNKSATPLDYDALLEDVVFHNLLHYRLQSLRSNDIFAFERTLASVDALIASIEAAVGDDRHP